MNQKDSDLDQAIDLVIKNCPVNEGFNVFNVLNQFSFELKVKAQDVREMMKDLGYVVSVGNLPVKLTSLGKEVRVKGGHILHTTIIEKEVRHKKRNEKIALWGPLILSLVAVLISIWTHLDSKIDKEELKSEIIQELKLNIISKKK